MKGQEESAIRIGEGVFYNPNGVDFGSRPKFKAVPAIIISEGEVQEFKKDGEKVERKRYNLIVFQDTDACTTRKVRVPHKDDALEGESFFE